MYGVVIINGVKYFSHELESVIEDAAGDNLVPSNTSAFSTWPSGSDSEEIIITFSTVAREFDDGALVATLGTIAEATLRYCSKKPLAIIPLPSKLISKSSLGKLSRSALKTAYEAGKFDEHILDTTNRVSKYRRASRLPPTTVMEKAVAKVFATEFGFDAEEIGIQTSLVDVGVDSIRLLCFKGILQEKLGLESEIPIGTLLTNPSIQSLSAALSFGFKAQPYNPVVVLQSGDSPSPPIWFIHPGLGEILVFLNISKYFSDRRVYALRAPGFNPGEEMFSSIDEMTK
jgi:acyl carrier protein